MADGDEVMDNGLGDEVEDSEVKGDGSEDNAAEVFDFVLSEKLLLGISSDTVDKILQLLTSMVKQEILNYCNLAELPSALNYTLCQMVVDLYRDNVRSNASGEVVGNVSSVSEDGRSVSFTNGGELRTSIEDRVTRTTELRRFKKLYRL